MQLTKSDILKLVKVKKANTFWNHFLYALKKDYKINGEIKKNFIAIWQKGNMTGAFYPVYTFEFNSENQLIKTTDRLNPFGRILQLSFPFTFFCPLILTAVNDFKMAKFLVSTTLFFILTLAFILIINKIYKFEKIQQLREFDEILSKKSLIPKTKPEFLSSPD